MLPSIVALKPIIILKKQPRKVEIQAFLQQEQHA